MVETTEQAKTLPNPKTQLLLVLFLALTLIVGIVAGWSVYRNQQGRAVSLTQTNASLTKQGSSLTAQLNTAKTAGNVSTAIWKTYCDPYGNFCFKYPPGLALTSDRSSAAGLTGLGMGSASLQSPSKTISVSYLDDYIKDDFPANFIVHSTTSLSQAGKGLVAIGGYYVSAGGHIPVYIIVNSGSGANDPSASSKPGQNITTAVVPLFQYKYGTNDALGQFTVGGKSYPTTQQADAWFDSIDGKTAFQIVNSFVSGSTNTGKYLNIPELGIRMQLTYNTQDAYYSLRNSTIAGRPPVVLLSVHSLDSYAGCSTSQNNDGVAGISTFVKGETDPVVGNFIAAFPDAPLINGLYYYIGGAQYDCTNGNAQALYSDARHDFINAYSTIEKIPTN
jgi:hypothetical protein